MNLSGSAFHCWTGAWRPIEESPLGSQGGHVEDYAAHHRVDRRVSVEHLRRQAYTQSARRAAIRGEFVMLRLPEAEGWRGVWVNHVRRGPFPTRWTLLRWRERNRRGYVICRRSARDAMLHRTYRGHFEHPRTRENKGGSKGQGVDTRPLLSFGPLSCFRGFLSSVPW